MSAALRGLLSLRPNAARRWERRSSDIARGPFTGRRADPLRLGLEAGSEKLAFASRLKSQGGLPQEVGQHFSYLPIP